MATQVPPGEDPLIAALPPQTDCITYLTLLEYQLTPQNLPTLNQLLSADNGTLAAEIGWDLLRLVLPMLKDVPDIARDCLDIIARRGNPREVIVRVAEELERLGEDENEEDDEPDEHGVVESAFAGEAPPVHLGSMTLDGMPQSNRPSTVSAEQHLHSRSDFRLDGEKLTSLLSMMSNLHPRIRTQYPSRFLATSLPAALRAYRTLEITPTTTSSFIAFLSKLSGKQRPVLPPRTSTAGSLGKLSEPGMSPVSPVSEKPTAQAALPDPESTKASGEVEQKPSENEKAVVQRLLQAVMLEVFDEYTSTFASTEVSSMQWTARLRAKREPYSMPTHRVGELGLWLKDDNLLEREAMVSRFVRLGRDLNLDVVSEIRILGDTKRRHSSSAADEEEAPEASEYPSSPAEIPLSTTGLVLLFAAQTFVTNSKGSATGANKEPLAIDPAYLISHLRTSNPAPSAAATDAALSLLYLEAIRPSSSDQGMLIHTLKLLQDTFTTSMDPYIRDNAHYIATLLLHCHCDRPSRLSIINDMLSPRKQSDAPIHDIQAGNVKSIAVEWLKDEIYPSERARRIMDRIRDEVPRGTPASVLANDLNFSTGIAARVFSADITPPPPAGGEPDREHLDTFLVNVPFYISSLNLLSILAKQEHSNANLKAVLDRGEAMLVVLEKWRDLLVNMATLAAERAGGGRTEEEMNVSDIYALEDAVGRAREAVDEP